ncbi:MAG: type II secretion system F family protein [Nitrososphaerales archaeon]
MQKSKTSSRQWRRQREAEKVELDFQDKFVALAIRIFGRIALKVQDRMPTLREDILKSNIFISPHAFVSLILFIATLSITVSVFGVYMLLNTGTMLFGLATIAPVIILGAGLGMPKMSMSSRATALDDEVSFVIGYLSVLITGGVSPIALLRRLSTSKLYPACAKEARRILTDIDVFGTDPMSAIDKAARYCPNKLLADFLGGYTTVMKIGGDVRNYMDMKQKEVFNYRTIKLKSATEFVGTMAEAYLAATVVLGTSLFILQAVQAMLQRGGGFNMDMIIFFAGVFMPMISIAFIYLLHSSQTKEPITDKRPHIMFGISALAIPVFLFMPLDIAPYLKLALGLTISTAGPAIFYGMNQRKKAAVENMLPSFVRDLAEVRKTGLAPEKGIQQLSTRNYGLLSKSVQRMANQVSWGVPLSKVMQDFGKDVKSWFVKSIGFILLEVVEIGGGTVTLFTSLGDFTQRSKELEKERKSMFRPYIFIPYFGAILTIVATVMIIFMMTEQISTLTEGQGTGIVSVATDVDDLTDAMFMAVLFQAWMMGLVAGKMGEWSLAAGYKHATALAVIGVLTIYMLLYFVKSGGGFF